MTKYNDFMFFVETTISFISNHGDLVYDECCHFKWDPHNGKAQSLFKKNSKNQTVCIHCDHVADKKTAIKIQKLVDYLNAGGRDSKKLQCLSKGIEIEEWAVAGPGRIVDCGASISLTLESLKKSFGDKIHPAVKYRR